MALWRVYRDWIRELLPCKTLRSGRTGRLCTRPNRAAAHPSTDTHTAGMRRQARRPLNRIRSHRIGKVWCRVGVLYRSEQRGGRRPETASKSDSPIMVAQACESRRAQPCQGQGLGACIALALAQKKALARTLAEVGNCRTAGRPPAQDGGRDSCPRRAALAPWGCALRSNTALARVPTGVTGDS